MKRGQLSKEEKAYIQKNKRKSVKALAKTLDRYEAIVANYLNSLQTETTKEIQVTTTEEPKPTAKKTFIVKDTLGRNKKMGSVVMTGASSMISDEVLKSKPRKNNKNKSHIFIMNPDLE